VYPDIPIISSEQQARYLARVTPMNADRGETAPQQAAPGTLTSNQVDYYIDGVKYFTALDEEIDALLAAGGPGRYFYMSAWWLGLSAEKPGTPVKVTPATGITAKLFSAVKPELAAEWQVKFDDAYTALILPKSGKTLAVRLQELNSSGVDVRVLAWVSPFACYNLAAFSEGFGALNTMNLHTLLGVRELRARIGSANAAKVAVNLVSHPLGAAHCKLVVCGNQAQTRAYTGGIDPAESRKAAMWHDLAVRVTGPSATGIYKFFKQLWDEQENQPALTFNVDGSEIPARPKGWQPIPDPPAPVQGNGAGTCVQVLRTLPQMNFSVTGPDWLPLPPLVGPLLARSPAVRKNPISFAPDGCFEFKVALKKAIEAAEKYIFIADQAFTSEEIMDWIRLRLIQVPTLKVILLHGRDPSDPKTGDTAEAVNNHLIRGLQEDDFSLSGVQNVEFCVWTGHTVHCKVTIIDDVFCIIGSANSMQRSLYTDVELSVAILDSPDTGVVRKLRRDLWAHYCGMNFRPMEEMRLIDTNPPGYNELHDLNKALNLWVPAWGSVALQHAALDASVVAQPLPLPVVVAYSAQRHALNDGDSRTEF
jgi:phosphatidylserine/phosphatidylglycerophosphate/cardiolipin synthase-like enzyme